MKDADEPSVQRMLHRSAARLWAVIWVGLIGLLVSGCGARPPDMARAAQPDWAVSILGGPIEIALIMRPSALLGDPIWGPTIQRSADKRKRSGEAAAGSAGPDVVRGGDALLFCEVVEVYGALLPGTAYANGTSDDLRAQDLRGLAVLRRVPPTLNPLAIAGRNGVATWRPPRLLPSGVAEYAPNPNANGYFLYVLPGGTWVFVDGVTAQRAGQVFAHTASAPPLPTFESDALVAIYAGPGMMNVARAKMRGDERARMAGIEGMSLSMRPGNTGEFVLRLKHVNDTAAKANEREVKDALARIGRTDPLVTVILAALVKVDIDRDDEVLTLRATIHQALLERIARE